MLVFADIEGSVGPKATNRQAQPDLHDYETWGNGTYLEDLLDSCFPPVTKATVDLFPRRGDICQEERS